MSDITRNRPAERDGAMPEASRCSSCKQPLPLGITDGLCAACISTLLGGARHSSIRDRRRKFPRRFGSYRLLSKIAVGGMGVVYKAKQKEPSRVVALKMIRARLLCGQTEAQRFAAEAQSVASLDHSNIVPLYEVGEHRGRHFFTMRFIEGGSLKTHLPRLKNDQSKSTQILITVARAVHHAHLHGIVHRDLKPTNILLDAEDRPYVSDFGLAKNLGQDQDVTQTGALLGTPAYMAPEQATGQQSRGSEAADIYSLGAILYELLTGAPPFAAQTPQITLQELQARQPTPPSAINARVHPQLEAICLRCLEKDPRRRHPSAEALALDLEQFLRKHEGDNIPDKPGKTNRLSRRRFALAAFAVAGGAGLAASFWPKSRPVVVFMDTAAQKGVYDGVPVGGTNANVLYDQLQDLPITPFARVISAEWYEETQILDLQPDLLVIHRSSFFHAINIEFGFDYPPFTNDPDEKKFKQWLRLYDLVDDKLMAFLGLVGMKCPQCKFLVYSRGTDGRWTDKASPETAEAYRTEWKNRLEKRFRLEGRVNVMAIDGGDSGSFNSPSNAKTIRGHVQRILKLKTK